jgi:DNA-binding MarR family transcriptional regulator
MTNHTDQIEAETTAPGGYRLDGQIGFLLRRAHQRHISIFTLCMDRNLTPQQFAVLARLGEARRVSQNELGRQTAMDPSTMNGVVQRLIKRGLIAKHKCHTDKRMILLDLTEAGTAALEQLLAAAHNITRETLAPLSRAEQAQLLDLLRRIG